MNNKAEKTVSLGEEMKRRAAIHNFHAVDVCGLCHHSWPGKKHIVCKHPESQLGDFKIEGNTICDLFEHVGQPKKS